jgi:predicted MFS family arabinose efflux permease
MGGDFRRLWAGAAVSAVGDGLRQAALPLLAARLTHDPRLVSLVAAAEGAAWLVFGLPSGALADRWDRRRIMVGCDLARALLVALLVLAVAAGQASIWLLVAVGFGLNLAETLFYASAQATIPAVVGPDLLARANGRMHAAQVLGRGFLGPPCGAALFVTAAAAPFAVDAVSFGLAALLVSRVRAPLAAPAGGPPAGSLRDAVGEGLRWLLRHPTLRVVLVLLAVWNLAESAALSVLVLYVLERLHLPETGYGLMFAALAAGGTAGSLLAERAGRVLGTGVALAVSVGVTVAAYTGLGLTTSPVLAGALMAVIGLAAFVWNVLTAALRQTLTPAHLLGRVSSAYRFVTWGVVAPGAGLGGLLAARFGLQAPFLTAAAALAVSGAATLPLLTERRLRARTSSG